MNRNKVAKEQERNNTNPNGLHVAAVTLEPVMDLITTTLTELPFLLSANPLQPKQLLVLSGRLDFVQNPLLIRHVVHFEIEVLVQATPRGCRGT